MENGPNERDFWLPQRQQNCAVFAHFSHDLHRNNSAETRISRAILISTKEQSFREESGIEVSQGIGNETHFRQLKTAS